MKKYLPVLAFFALIACSTTHQVTQIVSFVSTPPGATVFLPTGEHCVAPCSMKVFRRDPVVVSFVREGCMPEKVTLTPHVTALSNLISTQAALDSGKAYTLSPDPATATLACDVMPNPPPPAPPVQPAAPATTTTTTTTIITPTTP